MIRHKKTNKIEYAIKIDLGIIFVFFLWLYIGILLFYLSSLNSVAIIFCQFLTLIFISKLLNFRRKSLLIFIYPLMKYIYYLFYSPSWINISDFHSYFELLKHAFYNNNSFLSNLFHVFQSGNKFYYLTIINIYIPTLLFNHSIQSGNTLIFLLFNDLIFLCLLALIVAIYRNTIDCKTMYCLLIFLLFSPVILSFTEFPDRHLFSLFALLIFVRGLIKLENNPEKFLNWYFILSLIILIINKPQLIFGIILYFLILNFKLKSSLKSIFLVFSLIILIFSVNFFMKDNLYFYLSEYAQNVHGYSLIIKDYLGTLYWFLMPIIKYVYAVLSPFPWYKYQYFLFNSGGSILTILMYYLSSTFGVSCFWILFKYWKTIKKNHFFYKNFILFGLVMSLTIIFAQIGHADYLSIYMVFFTPLILIIGLKKFLTEFTKCFILLILINLGLYLINV